MSVQILQQIDNNLSILKAYSIQYSKVKNIRIYRLATTYVMAFLFPILSLNYPPPTPPNSAVAPLFTLKTTLAAIATVWTFAAFWLSQYEKKCIKMAAQLQELFDISVFSISWNKMLVSDQPSQETINTLSNKYKGNVDTNWYGNLEGIPSPYDVVISQRSNVVWDWRMREKYVRWIIGALITLLIMQFLVGSIFHMYVEDFLIVLFLPSLSAYTTGIRELFEHNDNIRGKKSMESKLNSLLENAIENNLTIDQITIRQVQDAIFILRKCPAMVPNFFWWFYRDSYNKTMQRVINSYKQKIIDRSNTLNNNL